MKKSTLSMLLALAPLVIQPACAPDGADGTQAEEAADTGTTASALLGGSKLLWPMQDGKATVSVCWLPLDLGGIAMPGGQFAVDAQSVLPVRKKQIQAGVEREWNGRTVMSFVGWKDCTEGDADIHIQPISTSAFTYCPDKGTASFCVEKIGSPDKGKRVFINLLWADEAQGEARYLQTVTSKTYDASKLLPNGPFGPAICNQQLFAYYTKFNAKQPITDADIAGIMTVQQDCLQNVANHEFGHLAGFSHEQNRKDVTSACAAMYPASTPDDPSDEDSPLGSFEEDSIMSYCRTTLPGTLTAEDVAQTNAFYEMMAPKLPSAKPKPQADTTATPAGDTTGTSATDPNDPAVPAKKKKSSPVTVEKGGCNGN